MYLHYENAPIRVYWKFYNQKRKISDKKTLILFIFLLKMRIVDAR